MIALSIFPKNTAALIGNLFKPFAQASRFEYLIQRWQYDDPTLSLDQFFASFRHSGAADQPNRIAELLTQVPGTGDGEYDGLHLIRDRVRLEETLNTWHLEALKEEMFYWDKLGRGIWDLFRGGSGFFPGFGIDSFQYLEEFKQILVPAPDDDCRFYSLLLIEEEGFEADLLPGIKNMEGLENLDKFRIYQHVLNPGTHNLKSWVSRWFKGLNEDGVFIVHNLSRREIILFVFTNGFSLLDYTDGMLSRCMIPDRNTVCFPASFPSVSTPDMLQRLLKNCMQYKIRLGKYLFLRVASTEPAYAPFNGMGIRIAIDREGRFVDFFPDPGGHTPDYIERTADSPERQALTAGDTEEILDSLDKSFDINPNNDGLVRIYYAKDQIKSEINWQKGLKHGSEILYYPNGQIQKKAMYQNHVLSGAVEEYSDTGVLLIAQHYMAGQLEGVETRYYPDGVKESETGYEAGKLHGNRTTWYPTGTLKTEECYQKHKLHGEMREYHPNGKLMCLKRFHKGFAEGPVKMFYPNGKLFKEGKLVNGCFHGPLFEFDQDGNIVKSTQFHHGLEVDQ